MRRLTLALALIVTAAAANPPHWVEVVGGTWRPSPEVLSHIEAALKVAVPNAAANRGHLPEWHSYTFQFQGRTPVTGRRYVFVNAFCDVLPNHADLTKAWIQVMDGGACFFSAKYDPGSRQLYDLVVNGDA
jgi:hypothetical protein